MALTAKINSPLPFYVFTAMGCVLLLGIMFLDGAFFTVFKASVPGRFANGKPFFLNYTGLLPVDLVLLMPTGFWIEVTGSLPALRLQSLMLCGSLQTFAVWACVESVRRGAKHWVLRIAPIWAFLWQYLGTAQMYPFYCFVDLAQHFTFQLPRTPKAPSYAGRQLPSDPTVPLVVARSIIPAALIAYYNPLRLVWFPPSGTSESQHQIFIAQYQIGGFIWFMVVASLAACFRRSDESDNTPNTPHPNSDAWFIKAAYAFGGLFSGLVHIVTNIAIWRSSTPDVSLSRAFIPVFSRLFQEDAPMKMYGEENLFFLQWDFIIVILCTSLWGLRTLQGMKLSGEDEGAWSFQKCSLAYVILGVANTLLGPGAIMSGILYVREDFLREQYVAVHREVFEDGAGKLPTK